VCATQSIAQEYYIRRAIEKKYEKKYAADKDKGEKAIDERMDAMEESDKKFRENIKPFPSMSLTIDMSFPNKSQRNGTIDYYYKNYDCASVMHFENTKNELDRMIINFKEGKSTMLMTDKKGKKTGMVMDMKNYSWMAKTQHDNTDEQDYSLKATNEYKTIEGYNCRKFISSGESQNSEIWITKDVQLEYAQFNSSMYQLFASNKSPQQKSFQQAGLNGMVIQIHSIPKDSRQEESIITFKKIKMGAVPDAMFSTAGYEITQMPSLRDIWDTAKEEK
jgi:hypothetical protein